MPKGPRGHKHPVDVVSNAVYVMRIATGEIQESITAEAAPDKAAIELGHRGGMARAQALSTARKKQIAKKAAQARWNRKKPHRKI